MRRDIPNKASPRVEPGGARSTGGLVKDERSDGTPTWGQLPGGHAACAREFQLEGGGG